MFRSTLIFEPRKPLDWVEREVQPYLDKEVVIELKKPISHPLQTTFKVTNVSSVFVEKKNYYIDIGDQVLAINYDPEMDILAGVKSFEEIQASLNLERSIGKAKSYFAFKLNGKVFSVYLYDPFDAAYFFFKRTRTRTIPLEYS